MTTTTDLLRRAAELLDGSWDENNPIEVGEIAASLLALADEMERIHRWAHLDEDAPSGTWGKGYEAARGWVRMQLEAMQEPKP